MLSCYNLKYFKIFERPHKIVQDTELKERAAEEQYFNENLDQTFGENLG